MSLRESPAYRRGYKLALALDGGIPVLGVPFAEQIRRKKDRLKQLAGRDPTEAAILEKEIADLERRSKYERLDEMR